MYHGAWHSNTDEMKMDHGGKYAYLNRACTECRAQSEQRGMTVERVDAVHMK
jgi:hypothetical protein